MGSAVSDNPNLKYVTSFRDRHGKRRFYFRYRGQKFKLTGRPGSAEFVETYARYLAAAESGALGRKELGYLKGSIGWVIEKFLASDVGFGKLKPGTNGTIVAGSTRSRRRLASFRSTI